ncbi:PLD nuclease N-terminal domain-containing protein [Myroides sp. WP-1]|uniref:PLD nuclease N-terminal domain-containing protein n=1 Tax=Myroides sp. WP-1 TaxID=2759944 RepID=UPI0015F889A9|nr:PLD nuclease N-terminal domain-containing protein [Myroides sp. WP-1]MBB1140001.1 PLDc_N domain-containing protein [Myroides sp. WP-1]
MSIIFWQLFLIGILLFTIYSLYQVSQSKESSNQKLLYAFLILFFPLLGSLFYFFVSRNKQRAN